MITTSDRMRASRRGSAATRLGRFGLDTLGGLFRRHRRQPAAGDGPAADARAVPRASLLPEEVDHDLTEWVIENTRRARPAPGAG